MDSTGTSTLEGYRAALGALSQIPVAATEYRALNEFDLLELNGIAAECRRILGGGAALIAGEIARRSAPEFGSQGLAQRSGHRTAEQFIKVTTGATGRDAVTAVRVGALLIEAANAGEVELATGEI